MSMVTQGTRAFSTSELKSTFQRSANQAAVQTASYGLRAGIATTYHLLPVKALQSKLSATTPYWRIELFFEKINATFGCDLLGDVIIGRGATADLDLTPFEAANMGVSRQHVLLRPSAQYLYLIDMDSTNGVQVNGTRLARNEARAVHNGFMVSLGVLPFTIRIIDHSTLEELRQRIRTSRNYQPGVKVTMPDGSTYAPDDDDTDLTIRPEDQGTPEQIEAWTTARYLYMLKQLHQADKERLGL